MYYYISNLNFSKFLYSPSRTQDRQTLNDTVRPSEIPWNNDKRYEEDFVK